MRWYCRSIILFSLLLTASSLFADEEPDYTPAVSQATINRAWFKPSLIENKMPTLCGDLLKKGEKAFYSGVRDLYLQLDDFSASNEVIWSNYGEGSEGTLLKVKNRSVYVGNECSGSGSDNEHCSVWASTSAVLSENDKYHLPDSQKIWTSENIRFLKTVDGRYLLVTAALPAIYSVSIFGDWRKYKTDSSFIDVYEVKENASWEKICGVNLKPTQDLLLKTVGIDEAFSSLREMYSVAAKVTGGSGGVTHGYYASMFMDKILYRPWSLSASEEHPGEIHPAIVEWGFLGIGEFEKVNNYKNQLEKSSKEIAKFYSDHYGWTGAKAFNLAHSAILNALNVDNKFGGYTGLFSDEEVAFRKAILEKKPLAEIKTLPVDFGKITADIAVTYPEALSYLLEKGVAVNSQNYFGKTPLMYAVQYNQLDSVKILLEKGANPNLFTVIVGSGLKRSGMTALHYAVRYASPEIIKTLLHAGAFPYSRTSESENFYPIDWLHIYTDPSAEERNPNIATNALPEIEGLLKLLSEEEKGKRVLQYILQGEKEYQQNHNKFAAYDYFKSALALEPNNERALNDFSLLSVVLGRWDEAAESARFIIEHTQNNLTKANAYYNYGLVCEKYIGSWGSSRFEYNGKSYCEHGALDPLLKSYQLKPLSIKAEKILSIFKENKIQSCGFPSNVSPEFQLSFICEEKSEACVLSRKDKMIDPASIFSVQQCSSCGTDAGIVSRGYYVKIHPSLLKTYELGDYNLGIYSSSRSLSAGDLYINGKVCDRGVVREPSERNGDFSRLKRSLEETYRFPRESLVLNPAALRSLFYVSHRYGRLHIKDIQGRIFAILPDNSLIKLESGDSLENNVQVYIPKGSAFSFPSGNLEVDMQNDRILKTMEVDDFLVNEGKGITSVEDSRELVDLKKIKKIP